MSAEIIELPVRQNVDQAWEQSLLARLVAQRAKDRGLTIADICGPATTLHISAVRRGIAQAARAEGYTYQQIGRALNRHHTTIVSLIHGRRA